MSIKVKVFGANVPSQREMVDHLVLLSTKDFRAVVKSAAQRRRSNKTLQKAGIL